MAFGRVPNWMRVISPTHSWNFPPQTSQVIDSVDFIHEE